MVARGGIEPPARRFSVAVLCGLSAARIEDLDNDRSETEFTAMTGEQ